MAKAEPSKLELQEEEEDVEEMEIETEAEAEPSPSAAEPKPSQDIPVTPEKDKPAEPEPEPPEYRLSQNDYNFNQERDSSEQELDEEEVDYLDYLEYLGEGEEEDEDELEVLVEPEPPEETEEMLVKRQLRKQQRQELVASFEGKKYVPLNKQASMLKTSMRFVPGENNSPNVTGNPWDPPYLFKVPGREVNFDEFSSALDIVCKSAKRISGQNMTGPSTTSICTIKEKPEPIELSYPAGGSLLEKAHQNMLVAFMNYYNSESRVESGAISRKEFKPWLRIGCNMECCKPRNQFNAGIMKANISTDESDDGDSVLAMHIAIEKAKYHPPCDYYGPQPFFPDPKTQLGVPSGALAGYMTKDGQFHVAEFGDNLPKGCVLGYMDSYGEFHVVISLEDGLHNGMVLQRKPRTPPADGKDTRDKVKFGDRNTTRSENWNASLRDLQSQLYAGHQSENKFQAKGSEKPIYPRKSESRGKLRKKKRKKTYVLEDEEGGEDYEAGEEYSSSNGPGSEFGEHELESPLVGGMYVDAEGHVFIDGSFPAFRSKIGSLDGNGVFHELKPGDNFPADGEMPGWMDEKGVFNPAGKIPGGKEPGYLDSNGKFVKLQPGQQPPSGAKIGYSDENESFTYVDTTPIAMGLGYMDRNGKVIQLNPGQRAPKGAIIGIIDQNKVFRPRTALKDNAGNQMTLEQAKSQPVKQTRQIKLEPGESTRAATEINGSPQGMLPGTGTQQGGLPSTGAQQGGLPGTAQQGGLPGTGAQQGGLPGTGAQQGGLPGTGAQQGGLPGTQQGGLPGTGAQQGGLTGTGAQQGGLPGTQQEVLPGTGAQQGGLPGTQQGGLPSIQQGGLPGTGAQQGGLPGTQQGGLPGNGAQQGGLPGTGAQQGGLTGTGAQQGGLPGTQQEVLPGTGAQQGGLPGTQQGGLPSIQQGGLPGTGAQQGGLPGTQQGGLPGNGAQQGGLPGTGAQQGGLPGTGAQQGGLPGTGAQQEALPGTDAQQGGLPGTGIQQGGLPGTGAQQGGLPGTGIQQGVLPGTGAQQGGLPGTGIQQGGLPGTGAQQGGLPGTGAQQGGLPGTGAQQGGLPGTGAQQGGLPGTGAQQGGLLGTGAQQGGLPGTGAQQGGLLGTGAQQGGLPGTGAQQGGLPGTGAQQGGLPGTGAQQGGIPGTGAQQGISPTNATTQGLNVTLSASKGVNANLSPTERANAKLSTTKRSSQPGKAAKGNKILDAYSSLPEGSVLGYLDKDSLFHELNPEDKMPDGVVPAIKQPNQEITKQTSPGFKRFYIDDKNQLVEVAWDQQVPPPFKAQLMKVVEKKVPAKAGQPKVEDPNEIVEVEIHDENDLDENGKPKVKLVLRNRGSLEAPKDAAPTPDGGLTWREGNEIVTELPYYDSKDLDTNGKPKLKRMRVRTAIEESKVLLARSKSKTAAKGRDRTRGPLPSTMSLGEEQELREVPLTPAERERLLEFQRGVAVQAQLEVAEGSLDLGEVFRKSFRIYSHGGSIDIDDPNAPAQAKTATVETDANMDEEQSLSKLNKKK